MSKSTSLFSNVKGDLAAGLVVFLIAVPLCLGIALASGAPLFSGIVTGIIGGIVVGFLSGSQLSVSGPAAGLIAIVLGGITQLGSFELFLCAVIIAGALQLILGFIKAGSIANYFPSNVIEGMLTAIGVTIILTQIPHALGYDKEAEGATAYRHEDGGNTFTTLIDAFMNIEPLALVITLVAIGILLLWQKVSFLSKLQLLPGALVAVISGVLINEILLMTGSSLALSGNHLVNLPVANNFSEFIGQFSRPDFSGFMRMDVWILGATIMIVGSIETLLCLEATDKLDPMKRYSSPNQELKAQGVGNMLSGFLGGLPLTSVIVRSSANINAGSKTKLSTIAHGTLLLICAALIPVVLNKIPLATLAAILIMTGYKLAKPAVFIHMWHNGKYQFIPFIVTVLAVIFTDLLTGVALGLVVSVLAILRGNLKSPYFFKKKSFSNGEIVHIYLSQEVSFLNKAAIKSALENIPEQSYVIIDASKTLYIDFDVLQLIKEFKEIKAANKNIRIDLVGFKEVYQIENTLDGFLYESEESVEFVENLKTHKELLFAENSHK